MPNLIDLPQAKLFPQQLAAFSPKSIQAKKLFRFDAQQTHHSLQSFEGQSVLGIDIGGTTIEVQLFSIIDAWLTPIESPLNKTLKSHGGVGYYDFLIETCNRANKEHVPIGVSYAGPLEGSQIIGGPNVGALLQEIDKHHGSFDFFDWLPGLIGVSNDAIAGLIGSSCHIARYSAEARSYMYLINGSGIGLASLSHSSLYATEAGHVAVIPELNRWGHNEPCEVSHSPLICLEKVIAGKAGIERIWRIETNNSLAAPEIEEQYLQGDELAKCLYDNSAIGLAHVIVGVAQSLDIPLDFSAKVICHGGSFKFPRYKDRVQQILAYNGYHDTELVSTYDLSQNTCLEGAALLALIGAPGKE